MTQETESRADLSPVTYARAAAPGEMLHAAKIYEKKYETRFASLSYFSKTLLSELHESAGDPTEVSERITVASLVDRTIVRDIGVLSEIVNDEVKKDTEHRRYFDTLQRIYGKLPYQPTEAYADESTLIVAVEREGRILAESLSWLPEGHSIHPDAKRILYKRGLLIGLAKLLDPQGYRRGVIIDGAIASGSTIITVLEHFKNKISEWEVFSVHGSYEGVRAIDRYSRANGLEMKITIGHATTGMNSKYYAVHPSDTTKPVVGDLGDMISDIYLR